MISYYEIVEDIAGFLQSDPEINTVTVGTFDDIDVDKESVYAIGYLNIDNPEFIIGMVRFNITIGVMDIVDERRVNKDSLPAAERWKGQDNKQDVLNQLLTVLERFNTKIINGTWGLEGWELTSSNINKFEERGDSMLTGWVGQYTIDIPNTIQNC